MDIYISFHYTQVHFIDQLYSPHVLTVTNRITSLVHQKMLHACTVIAPHKLYYTRFTTHKCEPEHKVDDPGFHSPQVYGVFLFSKPSR